MLATGGGAIVNMSSTRGPARGVGGLAAYVTAKHALEGLTKVAALDYAAHGVRVNVVAPGPILTDNLARAGTAAQAAAAAAMPCSASANPTRSPPRPCGCARERGRIHHRCHARASTAASSPVPAIPGAAQVQLMASTVKGSVMSPTG